jgi:cell division protein FtsW (lipid II flippase)
MQDKKSHYFDKPENIKKVLRIFYVICGGLILADFLVHRHVYHNWESLWGFYGVFGFVACVVLVLVAKEMRKLIMRKEDYYDK